jgi:hydroxymethylglutaryl-CoA lyase
MTRKVRLVEVGPRDGLQNEPHLISVSDKVELINRLSSTGLTHIEATSFVDPRWVPQMADAAKVMDGIERLPGVTYSALVPNRQGMEAALLHRVQEVAIFAAASEAFSRKNINCSITESIERFRPIIELAKADGIAVRGYVSTIVDCPYSGVVAPHDVLDVAARLRDLGCYEISLGDTLGSATTEQVDALLTLLLQQFAPDQLAGHFHDTSGRALENIRVCLAAGLRTFDASVSGLGGCPYAPGAKGNVATDAVCELMAELGYDTGIDRAKLAEVSAFASQVIRSASA